MNTALNLQNQTRIRVKKKSQVKMIWSRFRKNKLAIVGLAILVVVALFAIFGAMLSQET